MSVNRGAESEPSSDPADPGYRELVGWVASGLASGVAHEVNNPLSGLLQSVALLRRTLDLSREPVRARWTEAGFDPETLERLRAFLDQRGILRFVETIEDCGARAAHGLDSFCRLIKRQPRELVVTPLREAADRIVRFSRLDWDLRKSYNFTAVDLDVAEEDPVRARIDLNALTLAGVAWLHYRGRALFETCGGEAENGAPPPRMRLTCRRDGERAHLLFWDNGRADFTDNERKALAGEDGEESGAGPEAFRALNRIVTRDHEGRVRLSESDGGVTLDLEFPRAAE